VKLFPRILLILSLHFIFGAATAHAQNTIASLEEKLKAAKDSARVDVLNDLAWEWKGNDLPKAISLSEEALEISRKLKYWWGEATALNTLGGLYLYKSDYEKSLQHFLLMIDIAEANKDRRMLAKAYNNIGNIHFKRHDRTKALEYYISSLKIKEEIGEEKGLCPSYINVAAMYYELKKHDLALEYFMKALPLAEKANDRKYLGIIYGNLGIINREKGNYEKSLEFYRKSMKLKEEMKDEEGISATCLNIGALYQVTGQYDSSEVYMLRALALAGKNGLKDRRLNVYFGLTQLYIYRKENDKASAYFDYYVKLKDSIYSDQSAKQMADMLGKYEADKKAKEIEFLRKEQQLQVYESDRKTKEIELLNKDKAIQQYLAEQKNKEVALLNKEKELQGIETQKKQKEIELLNKNNAIKEGELTRQKLVNYSVLSGLALVSALGFMIFKGYRQKKKANSELESVNTVILQKKQEIEKQKDEIEAKNKDITDSIRYAKRIQEAILPPESFVKKLLPGSFILYKPKDIVSGDFYWVESYGHQVFFAACDCTGHGVPGALMSVIGYNLLNQAVHEHGIDRPAVILNELNKGVSKVLRQREEESSVKDGMDVSLCALNTKTLQLEYAGANNPLWIIRADASLVEIKADKFPIGAFIGEELRQFTNQTIQLQPGDTVYIFSDGYADQFGGEKGKKFKYKQLQQLLISIHNRPPEEQKAILDTTIEKWKGSLEQVDDILVMGVCV
jgi:serine phosphatase RsbU (regulator of sigma subunit)